MLSLRAAIRVPRAVASLHTTAIAAKPQTRPPSDGSGPLFTTPFEIQMGYRDAEGEAKDEKEPKAGTDKMNKMKGGKSFDELRKQRAVSILAGYAPAPIHRQRNIELTDQEGRD